MESHTLHHSTAHTDTSQLTVIEELCDWFLYDPQDYKNFEIQWIHQKAMNRRLKK